MRNKILTLLIANVYCLTFGDTINLNQEQLNIAKSQIQQSGNQAIANMPQDSQTLSSIKLNELNLKPVESEIEQANIVFKKTKPLSNKLPNGEKYYLYSESVVSDSKQALSQFKQPLDINQTITDYNALTKNAKASIADNRLLIFISSSMPKKTIINLMNQASSLGAVFVVRGLMNGSYVNTYRYFYNLKGDSNVAIMLNPTLFNALQVDSVPTFALYQSEQDLMKTACNVTPKYTKVSGEVSVHYALDELKRSTNADLAQIAANELDILDNQNFYRKHQ